MTEAPEELPFEPHPLVALPRPVRPGTLPLPSPDGEARKTGALSARTMSTTRAVAEALFSDRDVAPPPERIAWAMDEYEDLMARTTARGRLLFWSAATAISWFAPLLIKKAPPFRDLTLPTRVRALRAFEACALGGVLIALRAMLCIVYYEHPDAARAAGITLEPKVPRHG